MKRPLCLALCVALATSLLPGSACEEPKPTAHSTCPAEHVATVKEHLGLMREMNRILAAGMGEGETLAALEALAAMPGAIEKLFSFLQFICPHPKAMYRVQSVTEMKMVEEQQSYHRLLKSILLDYLELAEN